jgi:pyruvate,water dikinase
MSEFVHYVRSFAEIGIDDVATVGGKNASLGEMFRALTPLGVNIPNGFAVVADAYWYMLDRAGALDALQATMEGLDPADVADLARRGRKAREIVYAAGLPADLQRQILDASHALQAQYGPQATFAVRSSATAEDLPEASFAGAHETFLNVHGDAQLLDACRRCYASLFTDRGIHYRIDEGFDHFKVALSLGIMKMVRADLAASGVMFTLDTESGFRDVVFITGAYGLGENVVQGAVDPDEFYVFKPTFDAGHRAVLRRVLGTKKVKMVYVEGGSRMTTRNVPTDRADRDRFCIDDADVLTLADFALKIERHYSAKAGKARPMDIEWARDGSDGKLYVVQARPETVASRREGTIVETYRLKTRGDVLVKGRAVGEKIVTGAVRVIADAAHLAQFQPGEVLVADTTAPDWEPVMKTAGAVVSNRGGRTCHAAIVARELGIPAVVGTDNATTALTTGQQVTVSCADGDIGSVYRGELPFDVSRMNVTTLPRPVTKVMINLGNPDLAFKTSFIPNDGVGLARMEFIINEAINVHPMALAHPERVADAGERATIERLAAGYASPREFFIERLAEGVGTIAAAFYPKPVIVRMSDFKSNEYATLIGGRWFEPTEANPMIGFRGASRYAHPAYADGFALECAAMRRVRDDMGLVNVKLMIPFCRRAAEARAVIDAMAAQGLRRGANGLEIYVMCEIPNNVLEIDAFSQYFDGFSIGSNDLTQLTLGVDRDSEIVAFDYDERDAGVKTMIRLAVEGCKRNRRHSGLCGQAPSDYPDMAEFLVELGIDSISLNPDAVIRTTLQILEVERRLGRSPHESSARSTAATVHSAVIAAQGQADAMRATAQGPRQ